ncbi:copper resistance protein B [Nitrosomonas sp. HPC101]|uniref:copper resistance protein B n=1 Tax=Nitrosomonas sp. HPC101 TaxID=1658667 RepID=UPI001371D740|nr:copper resistance protein B [Nitrosomonas sp. HPC101]MXS86088.1 copper resistance protein B [Nitrosomonas sp. HPC101]
MKSCPQFVVGIVVILFPAADMPMANAETLLNKEKQTLSDRPHTRGEYHHPTHSDQNHAFLRTDVLEYRPGGDDSDFRWDIQGWYGGDFNRLWFKTEGERNTAFKADHDIDIQLLYGRFIGKYYDFQIGIRGETQTFRGKDVARAHAVIGFQGLAPYRYEIESALFISQEGDVSVRFQTSRDFLLTQRLILQGRFEAHAAVQKVEKFTTGRGLNNIELGFRLRYEIRREIAPYIGISYDRSFFRTADFVREEEGDSSQVRFVTGVQLWF